MRSPSLRRRTALSLSLVVSGFMLGVAPLGWTQAAGGAGAVPAPPTTAGLFPDPEPVLVEKASLRGLLAVVTRGDGEAAGPMIWQLLAVMFKAKEGGMGPSEFLAAGYRAERLRGTDAATVQNCLLSAWAGAQSLALFTPENIALMERGAAPRATRGLERGGPVYFDTGKLPEVAVTTKAVAPRPAVLVTPPGPAQPVKEPEAAPPAIVVKTLEVRLHERVPLDDYGLRNMDFRLDSVDPHGSVSFLFEDRTVHHFGQMDRSNSLSRWREMGFSDGVDRMTSFSPELIPDTKTRGIRLLTLSFGSVYLDEDIGAQVTFRIVVRVAREALMLEQLPPERRKLYEIHHPAP